MDQRCRRGLQLLKPKKAEFTFAGDILTTYTTGINSSTPRTRKLNYDSKNNVISVEDEKGIITEFLEYKDLKNPSNLIKSIGILRIDGKPFFTNVFGIEKAYPYEADDYTFSLTFYKYHYTLDAKGRVYQIVNDKTLIYMEEFIYE